MNERRLFTDLMHAMAMHTEPGRPAVVGLKINTSGLIISSGERDATICVKIDHPLVDRDYSGSVDAKATAKSLMALSPDASMLDAVHSHGDKFIDYRRNGTIVKERIAVDVTEFMDAIAHAGTFVLGREPAKTAILMETIPDKNIIRFVGTNGPCLSLCDVAGMSDESSKTILPGSVIQLTQAVRGFADAGTIRMTRTDKDVRIEIPHKTLNVPISITLNSMDIGYPNYERVIEFQDETRTPVTIRGLEPDGTADLSRMHMITPMNPPQ